MLKMKITARRRLIQGDVPGKSSPVNISHNSA